MVILLPKVNWHSLCSKLNTMYRKRIMVLLVAIMVIIYQPSYCQTCCSGGVPLSANIGLPSADKGSLQFLLSYDYNLLKTLKSGSTELDDNLRERVTQSVLVSTGYTFNHRFSLNFLFSFIRQERHIFTTLGTNSTITNGVGDGILLFRYNILSKNANTSLLAGLGPKIPMGSTDKTSENGITLPADLQPGSGAWDIVFWSTFSQSLSFRRSMAVVVTSTYRATGVNPDYLGSIAYEFGDELQIIAGIADQFVIGGGIWDPSVLFRYRRAGRDKSNEVVIDASGGEWIFLLPGIKYAVIPAMSVSASIEIPLYSYVNNTQLTPTCRFTASVYYKFDKE